MPSGFSTRYYSSGGRRKKVYKLNNAAGNRIGWMPKSWWAAFFRFISGGR